MKCRYCEKEATQTLVWLKDKQRRPARIRLPWCGCDLMEALRKIWPSPYQVQQGVDYDIEPLPAPINLEEKLASLDYCMKGDKYEDVLSHLFDLIHYFNHDNRSLAELCEIYGGVRK